MNRLLKYGSLLFTLAVFFTLTAPAEAKIVVPAPTISSPTDQAYVDFPVMTITGEATPGNLIRIKVNGKTKKVNSDGEKTVTVDEDGNFSAQIIVQGKKYKTLKVKVYSIDNETKSVSEPATVHLTLSADLVTQKYILQLSCNPGDEDDDTAECQSYLDSGYPQNLLTIYDEEGEYYSDWSKTVKVNNDGEVHTRLHKGVNYQTISSAGGGKFVTDSDPEISVSLTIN